MMNTLHKTVTIAFLAVSVSISGLSADLVSAQSSATEPTVNLTPEEQAWLKEHKVIRLGLDIKYLYKDMGTESPPEQAIKLTAEMLAGLPPDLLQELREAALGAAQGGNLSRHRTN